MTFFDKFAASLYLCKVANEMHVDNGKATKVNSWDVIKGIPGPVANGDHTDILNPNKEGEPIDIGTNNKQLVSGTGHGALILGKYRNE